INFLRSKRRSRSRLKHAWFNCEATDRYQIYLISKPSVAAMRQAGKTKSSKRVAKLKSGGKLLPSPWKILELVKTIPAATKLSATIRRYSLPNAITCGSCENGRINVDDAKKASSARTNIMAVAIQSAE